MTDIRLHKQNYKLFPYEEKLSRKEIMALLSPSEFVEDGDIIIAKNCPSITEADKLTFISSYEYDGNNYETKQYRREQNIIKRQNTRYYAHGIHEYKGKFNPQIVHTLLNIYGVKEGSRVLDPFCGSGTSLFECQLQGAIPTGVDINPMAAFIARVKTSIAFELEAITTFDIKGFIEGCQLSVDTFVDEETERTVYLHKWFDDNYYISIELIRRNAYTIEPVTLRNLILLTTSNFLRDYSLQEPMDLRIRRRKSPYPQSTIWERLEKDFTDIQIKLKSMSMEDVLQFPQATINNMSIIEYGKNKAYNSSFDFAITSPPYATALPYIDTQRLSIVWLGMALGKDIKGLECSLIGSREISTKKERSVIESALKDNSQNLTDETYQYCMSLQRKLSEDDGFRKQNVPLLLYKYFSEMRRMFEVVYDLLKDGAYYCLIVGYNTTRIGGKTLINTPYFLSKEAESIGFTVEEIMPLEAYQRYDLHQKNAISSEALIVLTK